MLISQWNVRRPGLTTAVSTMTKGKSGRQRLTAAFMLEVLLVVPELEARALAGVPAAAVAFAALLPVSFSLLLPFSSYLQDAFLAHSWEAWPTPPRSDPIGYQHA